MNPVFAWAIYTVIILAIGYGLGIWRERCDWNKLIKRGAIIAPERMSKRCLMEILK